MNPAECPYRGAPHTTYSSFDYIPTGIDLRCRAREPRASEGRRAATLRQSVLGIKLANTQYAVSGIDNTPHTFCESSRHS